MKFAKKFLRCMGCKTVIDSGALCNYCVQKEDNIYLKNLQIVTQLEKNYAALWTECQRCMGDICHEVVCSNGDCPIFYRRKKVQTDLDEATIRISGFQLEW